MCSCYCGLQGDNSGKVIMSEDLLKFILMRYRLERREKKKKWERLDVGGGVASFSSKLKCIHPTHPSATTDLFFSYYLIAFSLWRAGEEGEGNVHSGLKTNSLKNVGTKWKEAYSHGGSVSCHWPLRRAEIMCLWDFHKGYSFLDLGTRHEELPLARLGHPPKKKSPPPT